MNTLEDHFAIISHDLETFGAADPMATRDLPIGYVPPVVVKETEDAKK